MHVFAQLMCILAISGVRSQRLCRRAVLKTFGAAAAAQSLVGATQSAAAAGQPKVDRALSLLEALSLVRTSGMPIVQVSTCPLSY
jgi:hypothetical protein